MGWQFWIDRGGTFTDVVARGPDGRLHTRKLLSDNPGHYADAALHAIRLLLDVPPGAPMPTHRIEAVKMGTTVATNALLERRGARVVLVINEGFEDVIEIGRQDRPQLYALVGHRLPPLVERDDRLGMPGRLGPDGEVVAPLSPDQP